MRPTAQWESRRLTIKDTLFWPCFSILLTIWGEAAPATALGTPNTVLLSQCFLPTLAFFLPQPIQCCTYRKCHSAQPKRFFSHVWNTSALLTPHEHADPQCDPSFPTLHAHTLHTCEFSSSLHSSLTGDCPLARWLQKEVSVVDKLPDCPCTAKTKLQSRFKSPAATQH